MNTTDTSKPGLRRVLGPFDATCVVVGAIIGVGIFFNPGQVAQLAGSEGLAILAWAVGGGIALLGALSFAELGGLYPRTGGQYVVLRDAYGPTLAFLYVFCNLTAVQAGALGIIGIVCAGNIAVAVTGSPLPDSWLAFSSAILIVLLALANCLGVRWGASIQNFTVVCKVAALLVVIALAIFAADASPSSPAAETESAPAEGSVFGALFMALVPALFAYGGWQQALWVAGEIRDPHRNLPRAIIVGVAVVVAVYLLAVWAYFELLGYDAVVNAGALAADAVQTVWPDVAVRVVAGAVAISAFGVMNAQLLTGPRLTYALARDGRFLKQFATLHATTAAPVAAIVLLAVVAIAVLVVGERIEKILTGVVAVDALFFAATGLAVVVLRFRRKSAERPFRVPMIVPLAFFAAECCVIYGAYLNERDREAVLAGLAWVAGAWVLYLVYFRRRRREAG